ncbi:CLUMA_CG015055, isoform A [Clunio marinus]|uniref:CLUMA_CG015055, isoform A n=1 Tax=Clunio marinus TaxID=568069 RepID=A0A1J1IQE3_9DIPT|nr:CLUMA_CG015055, isoform A [Clunio marinus]
MTSSYTMNLTFDDNPDGIFYPGQTVKGQLEFIVSAPLKLRGLILTIRGSAMCNYSSDLTAEQEFFVQDRDLIGSKGAEPKEIQTGTYDYDFAHRLPRNIPYSIEGVYGYVKYYVMATLDLPWDMYDKTVEKPFTVKRYEDLNYMSGMRDPREIIVKKDIDSPSWIFWKTVNGYVILKGSIPKCGYAPEEEIKVDVEINNQSNVDIESVLISLQNVGSYVCQTPWAKLEKSTQLKMCEIVAKGVKAGYTSKIKEKLAVPATTLITSVMFCNVYQISYNVQISLKFRRYNNNLTMNIPVYIGSVGLKPVEELDKNVRIPPLWPPDYKVQANDKQNAEKENSENIDASSAMTEEAAD